MKSPNVTGSVTIVKEVDYAAALDGWTLAEIEEFLEDGDDEGREILASDAYVIAQDVDDIDYSAREFASYVQWRRDNGIVGRDGAKETP